MILHRLLLLLLCLLATSLSAQRPAFRDSGVSIIRLGNDTSFVHRFEVRGDSFYSQILSLPQGLRYVEGRGDWFPNGNLRSIRSQVSALSPDGDWTVVQETSLETTPDSTRIRILRDGRTTDRGFAGQCMITNNADAVAFQLFPFYGFRAPRRVGDSLVFRHVTGLGARDFVVKREAARTVSVRSSLMGKITLQLDSKNRLLSVDALGSSLNFTAQVYRKGVDFEEIKQRFAAQYSQNANPLIVSVRDTVESGQGISINYWRPSARGRKVFGGIVPMGRFWRFGANNATEISFEEPVLIAGQRLEAGRYSLFALPHSETNWELCFNKKTGIWGTEYDPAADVLRVPMQVKRLPEHVEQFTISLQTVGNDMSLWADWEQTRLSITVQKMPQMTPDVAPQWFLYQLRLSERHKNPANWTPEDQAAIGRHVVFLDSLGRTGNLVFAGRNDLAPDDPNMLGIALVKATSLGAAKAMMAPDPGVQAGIQIAHVSPYRLAISHFKNAPGIKHYPGIKMPSDAASLERLRAINRDVWQPFVAAYAAGSAGQYMALHTEDFIRATTDETKDLTTYSADSQRHFEYNRENRLRCEIAFSFFERSIGATSASERGIYRYTVIASDGNRTSYYGRFHVIHRLENGRWKIAVDYDSDEDGTIGQDDFEAGLPMDVFAKK